jgi:NAD(P)-dependent dehydrogenase (short-subunit alcohol dehydrogenase family)
MESPLMRTETANPPLSLQDQVIIITGGNGGLGRAIAFKFAEAGARLVLAATNRDTLEETRQELELVGTKVLTVPTDVRNSTDITQLVHVTREHFGQVDVLVNNAGISGPTKAVTDITLEEWNHTLDVNLTGAFLASQAVLPLMIAQGYGNIINISSIFGKRGYPYRSAYAASKWALIGFTQTLALEVGKHNVRVNAICPGPLKGDRIERVWKERARVRNIPWRAIEDKMVRMAALRRIPELEEAASVALFLASQQSSAMTGQALNVSAGTEMR